MADEGKLVKMERDFSPDVDALLPKAEAMVKSGKLQQALEELLLLEKQTRIGADAASNSRMLVAIVQMCLLANAWKVMQDHVVLLSKKHGLVKQAVTKMVQEVFTYVDKTPNQATQLELIDTLRTVTDGKIYVEIERARLTMKLAKIKETEGKITEAADILQELQVETFGSMEKREKTEFILEQMRLNLARKDYIRMHIISRKINIKYFENEDVSDLKLRYYELMIQYALHKKLYLDACKYYREVYNTKSVQEDTAKWQEILRFVVIFIALSPFDNEHSDLIHRIEKDKNLIKLPLYHQLIKSFIANELMRWPKIEEIYRAELQKSYVFNVKTPEGAERWKDLHSRVIEHNIRVVAKYYKRITTRRLTELLDLTAKETEEFLSKLVDSKTIYAKIDRLDGVVSFQKRRDAEEVVTTWTKDVHSLLELIAKTTHLINKEELVHKIATAEKVGQ